MKQNKHGPCKLMIALVCSGSGSVSNYFQVTVSLSNDTEPRSAACRSKTNNLEMGWRKVGLFKSQLPEKMVDSCHQGCLNYWTQAEVFVRREEEGKKPHNRTIKMKGLRVLRASQQPVQITG